MDDMENKGQGMVTSTAQGGLPPDSRSRDGGGKETFEPRSQGSPSNAG